MSNDLTKIHAASSDAEHRTTAGHVPHYEVICAEGHNTRYGEGQPAFTFLVQDAQQFERLLRDEPYSVALRFVQGQFDVQGDIVATKLPQREPGLRVVRGPGAVNLFLPVV